MSQKITNIADLQNEIARLKNLKREQEVYLLDQYTLLRKKIELPSRILGMVTSYIPGVDMIKGLFSSISSKNKVGSKSDWLTNTLRLGLPLVLNKTLLRNAGWLKKSMILLASESAAGQINQDKIESFVSKVANFIRPKKKKKKHKEVSSLAESQDAFNFGVPPESETS